MSLINGLGGVAKCLHCKGHNPTDRTSRIC